MKTKLFLLLSVLFFTCQNSRKESNSFDWLLGQWQRTNDTEGRQTFEFWQHTGKEEYRGVGFTLSEGDTVFKELLRIYRPDSLWIYEVTGVNEAPTLFSINRLDSVSFEGANPENEFPKVIRYEKSKDGFFAEIEADSIRIGFDFVPGH